MEEISLFNKIEMLFNLTFSSPLFLILAIGLTLMILDLTFISKKDIKVRKIYLIISIMIMSILSIYYFSSFTSIINTFIKSIVEIIYFPSVLDYMVMIICTLLIILIQTFIKKNESKLINKLSMIICVINAFIFFLILDQINDYNIILTNKLSIYSNQNLMILFELSMIIFAFWIIMLILSKVISLLINHKKEVENDLEMPKLKPEYSEYQKIYNENNYTIDGISQNNNIFTLEEYKQMRLMLNNYKNNKLN